MKDYRPGLENGSDPKRKVVMGVVALVAILVIGIALDIANHAVNHSETDPVPQEQPAENEPAEDEPAEETPNAAAEEEGAAASEDSEVVGGVTFSSASRLKALEDSDIAESLAEYVKAYMESKDLDVAQSTVDVLSDAIVDQQGASARLYVVGHDLTMTCSYDPARASWTISGMSSSQREQALAEAQKQVTDLQTQVNDLQTQLAEAQAQRDQATSALQQYEQEVAQREQEELERQLAEQEQAEREQAEQEQGSRR